VPTGPEPRISAGETGPSASDDGTQPTHQDDHAKLFYERLEQTGQLVDVERDTDIAALPPEVTHIRYPDGTVERIGFSAAPYGA
jgi:hypothetical protein